MSQWTNFTSGIKNKAAPIPLSFAIPGFYTQTGPGPTDPILLDKFTVQYKIQPPLVLPDNCSCGLTQASFTYSQPNIASAAILESIPLGNNRITMQFGSANPVLDITLANGLYEFSDVADALNIYVTTHDVTGAAAPPGTPIVTGAVDLFTFIGISSTQKLVIEMNPMGLAGGVFPVGGILVDFENPSITGSPTHTGDSIGQILGWNTTSPQILYPLPNSNAFVTASGGTGIETFYAPNVAGFSNTTAYVLYISIVTNSYQNGSTGQLLYSFPLGNNPTNTVVAYQPTLRYPVQLNSGTYSTINIWTADQSGNRLPWSEYQGPFQFSAIISKNKEDGSI